MTIVGALSVALGGFLPRLFGNRRRPCLLTGAAVLVAAVGVLLVGTGMRAPGWVFLGGYMLVALSGPAQPSATATMKELNRPESVAASVSVANALAYFGCGTIGQAGGLILDRYRDAAVVPPAGVVYPPAAYVVLFAFLTGLAVLNLVLTAFVPE